jgi:hypothetical protein
MVDLNNFDKLSNKINKTNIMKSSELEENLKAKFVKYYGQPVWADLDKNEDKSKRERERELFK